jgi:hypothetical protein
MQNKCAKYQFVLFYTCNLQKFVANNNFFRVHFFRIISSMKFFVFLFLIWQKKNFFGGWEGAIEYILYMSIFLERMPISFLLVNHIKL